MEISFSELRGKIVINLVDGKKLGNITDIIFEQSTAKVLGLIVPCSKSFFNFFKPQQDIFIPYHSICRIGQDTILVELSLSINPQTLNSNKNEKAPNAYVDYNEINKNFE